MNATSKCPTTAELRDLLEGNVADSDQAAIVSHLDRCDGCQQAVEALANSDSSLAITLQQAVLQAPERNSAYWPALQNVEQALTLDTPRTPDTPWQPRLLSDKAEKQTAAEIRLPFLDPPEDGSHLGSLANFNVVRVVGRGGMGIVLHAVDTCLQRDVAIKVLDPELSRNELAVKRFCREARAAASISHENVVAVHQVEEDESKDLPFLVMELITGESLEKKLQRDGRLSLKEIVSIGMQTAAGLAAAHEKGLIHRDIKPGNILLEKSGQRVKLTDFGLARTAEEVRLTRTGLVAGTPLYMSPEQASGEELDARSDLFSLGTVLYELAAGEPPFNGKTPLAVLKRVTEEQPVPLRERNPDLPEWFVLLVDRLLAKKPADRFQSAREVANTLEHFWALLKSSETVVCPKKKAGNPWKTVSLGVAAGLFTVLVGAIALFYMLPRHRDEQLVIPKHVLKGNSGTLWSVAVSSDGKHLAMGTTDDGRVKYWDIAGERVVWNLNAHKGTIWTLALSPQHLATASDDGPAKIWDLASRQLVFALDNSAGTRALAFDREGRRLLTGGRTGAVKVWDVTSGKAITTAQGHALLVGAVAFAPDGKTIASASADKTIKIWDAQSGEEKSTLPGHQGGVYGIAFSPDSRHLVSGSWDKTVRVWDLASETLIATLTTPTQDVWSVDFNAQGTQFAATGEDQMIRIWDFESKKEIAAFRASSAAIMNVRFVPEPGMIVAAGKEGDARVFSLADLGIRK